MLPGLGDKAKELTGSRASVSIEKAKAVLGWSPRYYWRNADA
jgi:hypothetical protein